MTERKVISAYYFVCERAKDILPVRMLRTQLILLFSAFVAPISVFFERFSRWPLYLSCIDYEVFVEWKHTSADGESHT
jgi:hypothetical protein